jgi:ABC-type nitrate/sulfonate/bicarbonate transport system substrate-binding protein
MRRFGWALCFGLLAALVLTGTGTSGAAPLGSPEPADERSTGAFVLGRCAPTAATYRLGSERHTGRHTGVIWASQNASHARISMPALTGRHTDPRVLHLSAFSPDPPTVLARASGALDQAGLDVELTITGSSTEQMQGLSDGTYDLVSTGFDNVLAWSGRAEAEIIAVAQTDNVIQLPIIAVPEIHDWSDLRGKPLAVDAADTAFALVLRRVLETHGLELDRDYSFVAMGATAARFQALQERRGFAAILNPPFDTQALAAGMVPFGDQRQVLPDYPGGVLAVRRDWAQANADDLVAFLRAWVRAGQMASADPGAAAAEYASAANLPPAVARARLPAAFNDGALQPAGLQTVLDLRTSYGYQLPMGPQLETYYDTAYYDAATADE